MGNEVVCVDNDENKLEKYPYQPDLNGKPFEDYSDKNEYYLYATAEDHEILIYFWNETEEKWVFIGTPGKIVK